MSEHENKEVNILIILSRLQNEDNNQSMIKSLNHWSSAVEAKHTIYVVAENMFERVRSEDNDPYSI